MFLVQENMLLKFPYSSGHIHIYMSHLIDNTQIAHDKILLILDL